MRLVRKGPVFISSSGGAEDDCRIWVVKVLLLFYMRCIEKENV